MNTAVQIYGKWVKHFNEAKQRISKKLYTDAKRIEPVVPLTRANTSSLPAVDSLVRASQEPLQAHQTVLLRAAMENELSTIGRLDSV